MRSFSWRLPPGVVWVFASAAILVIDAIFLEAGGRRALANWGIIYVAYSHTIGVAKSAARPTICQIATVRSVLEQRLGIEGSKADDDRRRQPINIEGDHGRFSGERSTSRTATPAR